MKKISVFLAFMLTFLFSACSSSMFDKLVEAYESSTKELASASSNDDCDRIHDELMEKLYKISQEYPDWEEIIQKEGEDSENVKKVTTAYKAWNNTLESATTDNHYMFMTYCNIPNAISKLPEREHRRRPRRPKKVKTPLTTSLRHLQIPTSTRCSTPTRNMSTNSQTSMLS